MSTSNPGKLVLITPSRSSPIPQLVKLIERLVHEGRLNDVEKLLENIEKKMRLGIGSVKSDPEDMEKLNESEKECEDLKVRNTKLEEEVKELIGKLSASDKIVCDLKTKAWENDRTLDVYQEKIKFFDLKVTQLNMELFRLWEKRSAANKINEQMRTKLAEAGQTEERLRRKLIQSTQAIKQVSRENLETKVAMESMKRKLPETDKNVEELKRQNIQAFQMAEKLSRQTLEINIAFKKLKREKLEADKVIEVHKKWFQNLAPVIKNVGADIGIFLKEDKGRNQAEPGNSKEQFAAMGIGP